MKHRHRLKYFAPWKFCTVKGCKYRKFEKVRPIFAYINIGTGKGTQIKEILDIVCELYPGAKWVNEKKQFPTYDSVADITLSQILLDFKPHVSREFMKNVIKEEMMMEIEENKKSVGL